MQPEGNALLIRADASPQVGTGHLMRCLALAQGWQRQGGNATFMTACDSNQLLQRLRDEGFQTVQLRDTFPDPSERQTMSQVLAAHPDAWVVLDGYHFDPAYQYWVKDNGHRLLVIDDMAHLDHYYADVVLNQNIHAAQLEYSCEADTRLLLGTDYVLLRREFWPWQGWQRAIPEVARKVLITLGGSDPDNQTLKVIHALQQMDEDRLEATVVVGASNPHWRDVRRGACDSRNSVRLVRNIDNIADLMAWADTAVTAGGATSMEMAFMGLPGLILVLAENQQHVADGLERYGAASNLGQYAQVSEDSLAQALRKVMSDSTRRHTMSERGKQLVDGKGAERVAESLDVSIAEARLQVRPARWEDASMLWQWANDPTVRANSFHSNPIPVDEHLQWYREKLASADTRFWIVEHSQVPVGQIRYDRTEETEAEINFSVARGYRGRGIGTETLALTADMACAELRVNRVTGVVLDSNDASRRAFVKAGFRHVGQGRVSDETCHVFVWECPHRMAETS